MRVGILGTGHIGGVHARQYRNMPSVELGYRDRNPARADSFKARFDAVPCDSADELIAWARAQPATLETRRELLRRLNEDLEEWAPVFQFLQENQAALRGRTAPKTFRDRMQVLGTLLTDPDTPVLERVRSLSALFTVYFGSFAISSMEGTPEEKRAALLQVAWEQIDAAHAASRS